MSYLGWLEITASRPGAARKATARGAAGCARRVRCAPCASSGAAQAKTRPQLWDLHGRFSSGTRGSGGCGFRGKDGGKSWGQRAKRTGPRTKALAWGWGWGPVLTRREGPAAPFPLHPRAAADGAPSPAKARFQPERRRHVVELEWFVLPHFPL